MWSSQHLVSCALDSTSWPFFLALEPHVSLVEMTLDHIVSTKPLQYKCHRKGRQGITKTIIMDPITPSTRQATPVWVWVVLRASHLRDLEGRNGAEKLCWPANDPFKHQCKLHLHFTDPGTVSPHVCTALLSPVTKSYSSINILNYMKLKLIISSGPLL